MKCCIEACDLRQPRKVLPRKTDHRQGGWRMQRRKGRCDVQLMHYLFVDHAMLPQLRSAMHDTVTDSDGGRRAPIAKEFSNTCNSVLLAGDGSRLGQPRIIAE